MIKIVVLGAGNLASHLINHFQKNDSIDLIQVYNRNLSALNFLDPTIPKTNRLDALLDADIYVLAVSDDAISSVSKNMTKVSGLILHTSGGKSIEELEGTNRKGVLYFPQSFTKGVPTDFSKIPVCIESEEANDLKTLHSLASTFSEHIFELDSKQRAYLHVSAVFVNNFVNHMYTIGNEICEAQHIPFEILQPIIQETVNKVQKIAPINAQTGPAIRNDQQTIDKHKALLNAQQKELYVKLTNSIQKYGKKL